LLDWVIKTPRYLIQWTKILNNQMQIYGGAGNMAAGAYAYTGGFIYIYKHV